MSACVRSIRQRCNTVCRQGGENDPMPLISLLEQGHMLALPPQSLQHDFSSTQQRSNLYITTFFSLFLEVELAFLNQRTPL